MTISRMGGSVDVTTPAWLYELLPFIYLAVGLVVLLSLTGVLSVLSGTLFVAAGVQVLLMRSRYRKALRQPSRVRIRARR